MLEDKYPWLKTKYYGTDETYNALNSLPQGWIDAFGELMCSDLDEVIRRDNLTKFCFSDAKEKWGHMDIYSYGGNDETDNIIEDYSVLSENICGICGKPDVYMTLAGWMYPCCEDCWNEGKLNNARPYQDCIDPKHDTGRMNDKRIVRRYSDKDGYKDIEYDISDKAEHIRKHWKERQDAS